MAMLEEAEEDAAGRRRRKKKGGRGRKPPPKTPRGIDKKSPVGPFSSGSKKKTDTPPGWGVPGGCRRGFHPVPGGCAHAKEAKKIIARWKKANGGGGDGGPPKMGSSSKKPSS